MGIDVFGLNLVMMAAKRKPLGRVATIGRQGLHVSAERLRHILKLDSNSSFGPYCEQLLVDVFGATSVTSYDNSAYEGATVVWDMNLPLASDTTFDTVIDGGCLEHIFDVAQALRNVSSLCAPGGQILHILPANNYCGHGFWQFSPELFFSLYSDRNGYRGTRVFLAELWDENHWYEVNAPRDGNRVNILSCSELYALVVTNKGSEAVDRFDVQQSDYLHAWQRDRVQVQEKRASVTFKGRLKSVLRSTPLIAAVNRVRRLKRRLEAWGDLERRRDDLKVWSVDELVNDV